MSFPLRATGLVLPFVLGVCATPGHGISSEEVLRPAQPLFREVAKLFQTGTERVNLSEAKDLLVTCAKKNTQPKMGGAPPEELFEALGKFFEYMDSHRAKADDIVALREWAAATFSRKDAKRGYERDALGHRVGLALRHVWFSVKAGEGAFEPRHAILGMVLGDTGITLPLLGDCALAILRKQKEPHWPEDLTEGEVPEFLLDERNKALWVALAAESVALDRSRTGDEWFNAEDLVQSLLENKENSEKFERNLDVLMPLCEKLFKSYPDYALAERFLDTYRLRSVTNIVQAYGDEVAKTKWRAFVTKLHDFYKARSDVVTATWLREVKENPGEPPEKYLLRFKIVPPGEK